MKKPAGVTVTTFNWDQLTTLHAAMRHELEAQERALQASAREAAKVLLGVNVNRETADEVIGMLNCATALYDDCKSVLSFVEMARGEAFNAETNYVP